ncbi:MAG: DNRLRE domain-containing protein [bacterium]|nr:DNRLRE domain-containing protein [bacterium]
MFKYSILAIALLSVLSGASLAYKTWVRPTDDAKIVEGAPDLNFGDEIWGSVGKGPDPYTYRLYTALKFDFSNFAGYTINRATLGVHTGYYWGTFPPNEPIIARVHSDWSEDTITWNNHPQYDAWKFVVDPPYQDWWYINVTKWVRQWVNGTHGNYGVYLKANSISSDFFWIKTKEFTARILDPRITVIYTERSSSIETESLGKIKAAFK